MKLNKAFIKVLTDNVIDEVDKNLNLWAFSSLVVD